MPRAWLLKSLKVVLQLNSVSVYPVETHAHDSESSLSSQGKHTRELAVHQPSVNVAMRKFKVTWFSEAEKHSEMTEKKMVPVFTLSAQWKRHKHSFLQELPELMELRRRYKKCPGESSSWIKCFKIGSIMVDILGTIEAKVKRRILLLLGRRRQ